MGLNPLTGGHAVKNHRILFITGTDTGVGKTVFTALLLTHLRRRGVPAFAIKPFCSGSRSDARWLYALQGGDLTLQEINPFFFPEPLAPLIAARRQKRSVRLEAVLEHIGAISDRILAASQNPVKGRTPVLLIEGVGGLLVPTGPGYFVLDLIRELRCEVIVVSRNQLGTLNHTLLTLQVLAGACPHLAPRGPSNRVRAGRLGLCANPASRLRFLGVSIVLMEQACPDRSASSNLEMLSEFVAPGRLWRVPYLGKNLRSQGALEKKSKKIQKTLAQIVH